MIFLNIKPPINKLIEIAKSEPLKTGGEGLGEDEMSELLNEAQMFSMILKIRAGRNKVLASTIYEAYGRWAITQMSKLPFFKDFAKIFEAQSNGKETYYMLNWKPMELIKKAEENKDKRNEKKK